MRPAEQPAEVAGIGYPDPSGDFLNRNIRLRQQVTCLGDPAFGRLTYYRAVRPGTG
jgi:hypothetical protein